MRSKSVKKPTGVWKPIELDENLAAKGLQEGLIGIEELRDYRISSERSGKKKEEALKEINVGKSSIRKIKKAAEPSSKSKKKEGVDVRGDKPEEKDLPASLPSKRKKRKAKKKKKKVKKAAAEEDEEEDGEEGDSSSQEKKLKYLKEEEEDLVFESEDEEDLTNYAEKLPGWSNLSVPESILRSIYESGFVSPTPIQKYTLPAAIQGRLDIVGAAETGSGKTLAFGIPIIHGIMKRKNTELLDESHEKTKEENIENLEEENIDDIEEESMEVSDNSEDSSHEDGNYTSNGIGCVKVIDNADFGSLFSEAEIAPNPSKRLYALILTPTRELAIQIKNHLNQISKYTNIRTEAIVGGMAPQKQVRVLSRFPEIVVATPGRLWDLIQDGNPHLCGVSNIDFLAIDETDRMVEKGHFDELEKLLELLKNNFNNKRRQTFVFSATLSLVHELPKHLKKSAKSLTPREKLQRLMSSIGINKDRVKIVDITRKFGTAENLTESRVHCDIEEKDFMLYYIRTQHPGRTIVFCNSIDCVRRLVNLFQYLLTEPLGLHSQMHQKQRLKNLERFSQNDRGLLIATDVAARGLDIPRVEHVIHYQVPRTSESYVHRSGRTARAEREGVSVMFIEPKENYLYKKICKTLNRDKDLPMFPVDGELMSGIKQRVNIARELDKALLTQKKEDISKSWLKKAAEEADLEYTDSEKEDDEEQSLSRSSRSSSAKIRIESLRSRLHGLLATPLIRVGFSGKYPTKSGSLKVPSSAKKSALSKLQDESVKNILKKKNKKSNVIQKKSKKKKSS